MLGAATLITLPITMSTNVTIPMRITRKVTTTTTTIDVHFQRLRQNILDKLQWSLDIRWTFIA